jgi:hypothetical protein
MNEKFCREISEDKIVCEKTAFPDMLNENLGNFQGHSTRPIFFKLSSRMILN